MSHEARQVPAWLIFDVRQKKTLITLQEATSDEFDAYREYAVGDSSADGTTRQEFEKLLPEGLRTRNQHLLSIRKEDGVQVGFLWLTTIERKTGTEGFLLDLVILPPFRRHGYAKEAMRELEDYVSNLGLDTISLSVSQHNVEARTLYDSLSYEPVFTRLTKQAKRPNKAPEPTTTAVTPPAAQESRQP